jgi:hypothetical protein
MLVSGLHWTIPNGTSAPGKVLPPPVVPMNGLTRDVGSLTKTELALAAVMEPSPTDTRIAPEATAPATVRTKR